jgi:hypothetical protein
LGFLGHLKQWHFKPGCQMMLIIFQEILLKDMQLLEILLMTSIVALYSNLELISYNFGEWLKGLLTKPKRIAFTISSIFEYFRMRDMLKPTSKIRPCKYILRPVDHGLPTPSDLSTFQQTQAECILLIIHYLYHPSALSVKTKSTF